MSGVHQQDRRRRRQLSEAAYDALLEALSVFYWYRTDFSNFLRASLQEYPGLLAALDFSRPKRRVASDLVALLRLQENRYQDVTIDLLVKLSQFDPRFPRLARLEEGAEKVAIAGSALKDVKRVVDVYRNEAEEREELRGSLAVQAEQIRQRRDHEAVLQGLHDRFVDLSRSSDAQRRGLEFERLLNDVFILFDLQPRPPYRHGSEQIDGAFTFGTDDYLLEAKWQVSPVEPSDLDILKAKIDRKVKNVLGLFVAVNGFTVGAIHAYSSGTPMILMDGMDLLAVLEGRISLLETLDRKRRHAAETGVPFLSVRNMLD